MPPAAYRAQTVARPWASAGREPLSLKLIETRNQVLALFAAFEKAGCERRDVRLADGRPVSALWLLGRIGWFAERWTSRNTQRALGERCPPQPVRLGSIEPNADLWWGDSGGGLARQAPDATATRGYLLESLESTLGVLDKAEESDDGLFAYRMALFHEALQIEVLAEMAQALGVDIGLALPPGLAQHEPIGCPATTWRMGAGDGGGWWPDVETGASTVRLPEFEIDAQPATWAQYAEFVGDGGYDRRELWHPDGWLWLGAQQGGPAGTRRGPRHVEHIGSGAVTQWRFGTSVRGGATQAVLHVSWWEADAYARWLGRRLPHESEWDCAAQTAARRGFVWGQAWEWTSGTLAAWDGQRRAPWSPASLACYGRCRVLKGGSFATASILRGATTRWFALPSRDEGFTGFRTCAL